MDRAFYATLPARGVLEVAGADRIAFLQGLVSNDVAKADPAHAVFAALLTAQGKYLHDFFILALGETLYLECEAAAWGDGALANLGLKVSAGTTISFAGGLAYVDPRFAEMGARFLLPRGSENKIEALGFSRTDAAAYDRHRLALGVPDGSRDLVPEKSILLENGFEELNGVDFGKGCYMGQELTARTKYRALIRKRLVPVSVEGPLPAPGTLVMAGDQEAGELRSGQGDHALALLKLDTLAGPLIAGTAKLIAQKPGWLKA
jgi:hypothetical protein